LKVRTPLTQITIIVSLNLAGRAGADGIRLNFFSDIKKGFLFAEPGVVKKSRSQDEECTRKNFTIANGQLMNSLPKEKAASACDQTNENGFKRLKYHVHGHPHSC
jgi:hypothetical protein